MSTTPSRQGAVKRGTFIVRLQALAAGPLVQVLVAILAALALLRVAGGGIRIDHNTIHVGR
jgi:putative N-acetylmannosamine-6-phosphate epimerase